MAWFLVAYSPAGFLLFVLLPNIFYKKIIALLQLQSVNDTRKEIKAMAGLWGAAANAFQSVKDIGNGIGAMADPWTATANAFKNAGTNIQDATEAAARAVGIDVDAADNYLRNAGEAVQDKAEAAARAVGIDVDAVVEKRAPLPTFVKVANSTNEDIWVCVDAKEWFIKNITAGNIDQKTGSRKLSSHDYQCFDINTKECWATAFSSNGDSFGGPKRFVSSFGTYFNIVVCDDYEMRKGFKNGIYRVAEGPKEYYGPVSCDWCNQQKCEDPMVKRSDGWCGKSP